MSTPLLEAQHIEFVSPSGELLLQPTSLHLNAGDSVTLTGPSGSGKSLLLRGVVLLNAGQKGEVRFQGESVSANIPQFRSRCIYVPQRAGVRSQTVEEFLREPFQLASHRDRLFDEQRIKTWLAFLHRNETLLRQQTTNLSGGERQIFGLLRALQLDPAVMLLDEPTSALDQETTLNLEALVQRWLREDGINADATANSGRSVIWVSHNASQANRVATAHWRIEKGKLSI